MSDTFYYYSRLWNLGLEAFQPFLGSPFCYARAEEDVGAIAIEESGDAAESGSGMSGLGGLGLEGIVGRPPAGESAELPTVGEGNKGVTSGERRGGADDEMGMNWYGEGAAEMVAAEREEEGVIVRRRRKNNVIERLWRCGFIVVVAIDGGKET
ncbi:hypothetical protein QJS10_CPB04g00737 [Acorus calamus]|uniref:Uncharacterized protein n=1 Tax=Acorus calamus TaxID=4465 RepID=A0AAV9F1C0_ACOCL|nr:hypothetical protein QJS10_CPB04g00737 [Acorus calamus]